MPAKVGAATLEGAEHLASGLWPAFTVCPRTPHHMHIQHPSGAIGLEGSFEMNLSRCSDNSAFYFIDAVGALNFKLDFLISIEGCLFLNA